MNPEITDRTLREAGAHLARTIRALHDLGEYALVEDAIALSNRILLKRRALTPPRAPAITIPIEVR